MGSIERLCLSDNAINYVVRQLTTKVHMTKKIAAKCAAKARSNLIRDCKRLSRPLRTQEEVERCGKYLLDRCAQELEATIARKYPSLIKRAPLDMRPQNTRKPRPTLPVQNRTLGGTDLMPQDEYAPFDWDVRQPPIVSQPPINSRDTDQEDVEELFARELQQRNLPGDDQSTAVRYDSPNPFDEYGSAEDDNLYDMILGEGAPRTRDGGHERLLDQYSSNNDYETTNGLQSALEQKIKERERFDNMHFR